MAFELGLIFFSCLCTQIELKTQLFLGLKPVGLTLDLNHQLSYGFCFCGEFCRIQLLKTVLVYSLKQEFE